MSKQLSAINARLDELEVGQDLILNKIDRLSASVAQLSTAVEQTLTSLTAQSRRIAKLENDQ